MNEKLRICWFTFLTLVGIISCMLYLIKDNFNFVIITAFCLILFNQEYIVVKLEKLEEMKNGK